MQFTKMHGAGNDYIYIDCFAQSVPDNLSELARQMSYRRFGIGGDGLVLICPSDRADAEMRMFNVDGSPAEMCGNAIRCVAKYLYDHDVCRRKMLTIESAGNVLELNLSTKDGKVDHVRVDMGAPILTPADVPTTLRAAAETQPVCGVPLRIAGREFPVTCVSMGNPHCVTFVDELSDDWVLNVGPQIEVDAHFPNRVNVEFVQVLSRTEVEQRTWERGSGETWACGTGASSVCVAGVLTGRTERKIVVHLRGGDLEIHWDDTDNHVYKTGPAVEVFTGEWKQ